MAFTARYTGTSSRNRRLLAMLATFVASVVGAFIFMSATNVAVAAHPAGHAIKSIRSSSLAEEYCIGRTVDVNASHAMIVGRINGAIKPGGSGDWDGIASGKVSFTAAYTASDCYTYLFDLYHIDMRYWIDDNHDAVCKASGVSCVYKWGTYEWANGTAYWDGANLYLREDHTTSTHIVNHETGHALGLTDPGPCSNNSVMHETYYCAGNTNWAFPTSADRSSVTTIANN